MALRPICEPVELPLGKAVIAERVKIAAEAPVIGRFRHYHDVAELVLFRRVRGDFIARNRDHWAVAAAMKGAQPAVVAMLAWTVWEIGPSGLKNGTSIALALAAFVALVAKVHPAIVIVAAVGLGLLLFRT